MVEGRKQVAEAGRERPKEHQDDAYQPQRVSDYQDSPDTGGSHTNTAHPRPEAQHADVSSNADYEAHRSQCEEEPNDCVGEVDLPALGGQQATRASGRHLDKGSHSECELDADRRRQRRGKSPQPSLGMRHDRSGLCHSKSTMVASSSSRSS